jgi:hypothetical protein
MKINTPMKIAVSFFSLPNFSFRIKRLLLCWMPNLLNAYPEQNSYYICLQSITHARKRQIVSQFICLLVKNSKFHTHHILSEPVKALTSVWSIAIRICNRRDAVSRSTSKTVTYVVTDYSLVICLNVTQVTTCNISFRIACQDGKDVFFHVHIRESSHSSWRLKSESIQSSRLLGSFHIYKYTSPVFWLFTCVIRKIIDPNGKARNIYCRPTNMNLTSMLVT